MYGEPKKRMIKPYERAEKTDRRAKVNR